MAQEGRYPVRPGSGVTLTRMASTESVALLEFGPIPRQRRLVVFRSPDRNTPPTEGLQDLTVNGTGVWETCGRAGARSGDLRPAGV